MYAFALFVKCIKYNVSTEYERELKNHLNKNNSMIFCHNDPHTVKCIISIY